MNIQPQTDGQSYEYTTFPRVFVTYAWFKPLLVALLTAVFSFTILGITILIGLLWLGDPGLVIEALTSNSSPYFYSGPGLLMAVGGVSGMLPALALAERIVRGRPFSSYSSSRGGWNWAAFVKCFALAAVVFGAELLAMAFGMPDAGADGINKFTIIGAVICIVVVPLQTAAEEYIYRGLLMQSIGSWTKLPALAVVLSAIIFGISHSRYDVFGITAVSIQGLGFAFLAWYSRGLEASSAAHAANNLSVFIFSGLGLGSGGSGGIETVLISSGVMLLYCACIVLL
ncbi:MAG: CPBP family intramembrane metalloprotease, partial [Atopobiaceae bacterium]|nr:CPBP family intramembrane metalloprotease [Atopobiaceae bacterium]